MLFDEPRLFIYHLASRDSDRFSPVSRNTAYSVHRSLFSLVNFCLVLLCNSIFWVDLRMVCTELSLLPTTLGNLHSRSVDAHVCPAVCTDHRYNCQDCCSVCENYARYCTGTFEQPTLGLRHPDARSGSSLFNVAPYRSPQSLQGLPPMKRTNVRCETNASFSSESRRLQCSLRSSIHVALCLLIILNAMQRVRFLQLWWLAPQLITTASGSPAFQRPYYSSSRPLSISSSIKIRLRAVPRIEGSFSKFTCRVYSAVPNRLTWSPCLSFMFIHTVQTISLWSYFQCK